MWKLMNDIGVGSIVELTKKGFETLVETLNRMGLYLGVKENLFEIVAITDNGYSLDFPEHKVGGGGIAIVPESFVSKFYPTNSEVSEIVERKERKRREEAVKK